MIGGIHMKYEIIGKTVPAVEVTLDKGESMYTQSGGMSWQTEGIKIADSSGVSRYNLVSSEFMSNVLVELFHKTNLIIYLSDTIP